MRRRHCCHRPREGYIKRGNMLENQAVVLNGLHGDSLSFTVLVGSIVSGCKITPSVFPC